MKTSPPRAYISAAALDQVLRAHEAARGGVKEPCGLMLGRVFPTRIHIEDVRVLDNVHPVPDRAFLLPAPGAVAAAREGRERGLAVIGVWHGHLRGSARLSDSDAVGLASASRGSAARSPDATPTPYVFLVSGAGTGTRPVVRAFVHRRTRPREVRLDMLLPRAASA